MTKALVLAMVAVTAACAEDEVEVSDTTSLLRKHAALPNGVPIPNSLGMTATVSTEGAIDLTNEFFADLGTNGRRCVSCHLPTAGWSVTPAQVQQIFFATRGGVIDDGFGLGAMFRLNDGANSPHADVSTFEARRRAYSMLLTKGLIRVGIGMPANAEFELVEVDDPYGFASAAELSLFRRPLPTTNLKFLSAVMWDGRETFPGESMHFDLRHQANGANTGHAEGRELTDAERDSIVTFEMSLHTAATFDRKARHLNAHDAKGGPDPICDQEFYIGINDLLGDSVTGAPFNPVVFDLYDTWDSRRVDDARRAVARGQKLFNTRTFAIEGVSGVNDEPMFGSPASLTGTCSTCHDTPNGGNHSVSLPVDIGLVAEARRTPDMPLYTLRNKTTGEIKRVTDPGRALISGKWQDIGRFKGPILRGLAARPPYFHDGSAATIEKAVEFYNDRFGINLSRREKADLVAFLRTL